MAAPTEVNSTFTAGSTSAVTSIAADIGTNQNNDILVAFVWCIDAAGTIATPAGYAQKFQDVRASGQTTRGAIFWKRTSGSETSQTFSWTNAVNRSGAMVSVIRDCPTSGDPFDHVPSPTNYDTGAKSAQNAPQAVTTVANTLALMFYWGWTGANDTGSSITITGSQGQSAGTQGRTSNRFPMAVTSEALSGTGTMTANSAAVSTSASDAQGWFHTVTLKPASATPALLAVTANGASTAIIALRSRHLFTAAANGVSSLAALVRSRHLFSVTVTGASSTTIGLRSPALLAPTATGASTAGATLSTPARLTATANGTSSATIGLRSPALLSATANGASAVIATVSAPAQLSATANGVSSVAAEVTSPGAVLLTVTVAGASSLTALVRSPALLTATAAGSSSASATVSTPVAFTVTASGASSMTAAVVSRVLLSPSVAGTSSVTATVGATPRLTVAIAGVSGVTAIVQVARFMSPATMTLTEAVLTTMTLTETVLTSHAETELVLVGMTLIERQ